MNTIWIHVCPIYVIDQHLLTRQLFYYFYIQFRPNVDIQPQNHVKAQVRYVETPVLREGILGNYEPKEVPLRHGLGENGIAVALDPAEKDKYEKSFKNYGFNMVISDRISLDRSVPDIRDPE